MPRCEHIDYKPYMGTVQLSRVSGKVTLFGSEARHQHFIALRINRADRRRDLSRDWIHSGDQLVEVYLTEAQFASLITSLNVGDGTPCTLHWLHSEGYIKGPGKPESRADLFHAEMMTTLEKAIDRLTTLRETKGLTAKARNEIDMALQDLQKNTGFVADQFSKHMEDHLSKSKAEIEAYLNAFIQREGLKALAADEVDHRLEHDDLAPADHTKGDF
jgi:hypothetical protein